MNKLPTNIIDIGYLFNNLLSKKYSTGKPKINDIKLNIINVSKIVDITSIVFILSLNHYII